MSTQRKNTFNKVLNSGDLLVTAFGAMIGWGWVVSSGDWIQSAGVLGTVIGFLLGGLMIYFVGLVYAELTTAMPRCGGEHVFSYRAFGPIGSFICTWAIILSYVGVVCFEACSLPTVIQYIFPNFMQGYLYSVAGFDIYATWLIVAVISAIVITYINIKGVKTAAVVQTILTVIIGMAGIILVVASAINGSPDNFSGQFLIGETAEVKIKNILSVATIAPFFLFGFDVIPQVAEEINVPLKKVGKILVFSIALAVSFYALVVFAVGYAMNVSDIATSQAQSGLVSADAMSKLFSSEIMSKIIIIGGICGIITSWNSFLIGGSRAIFAMAEAHMIPALFAKLHKKHKTPISALLFVGVFSVFAPFWGRVMLVWISNAASFACCVAYFLISISFLVLRKKEPELERPYKIKHYRIVGIMSAFLCSFMVLMYLIPGTSCSLTVQEWIISLIWAVFGITFAIYSKIKYKDDFCSL